MVELGILVLAWILLVLKLLAEDWDAPACLPLW